MSTRAEQVAALSDEMVRFMLERLASDTDQRCAAAAKDYKQGDMWGAGLSFGLGSIKGSIDTWFDLLVKEQAKVEAEHQAVVDEFFGTVVGGRVDPDTGDLIIGGPLPEVEPQPKVVDLMAKLEESLAAAKAHRAAGGAR